MADIRLDFAWEIESDGEITISLSPTNNSDIELGRFTLSEELFLEELDEAIEDFEMGHGPVVFDEFEALAASLHRIADEIQDRIAAAKVEKKRAVDRVLERIVRSQNG